MRMMCKKKVRDVDELLFPKRKLPTRIYVPGHGQMQIWHLRALELPVLARYASHRDWSSIGASIEVIRAFL
jgi:hypothetical protein